MYENFDLSSVITPVNVENLEKLLMASQYDRKKSQFLINGFRHGFSLEYKGSRKVKMKSPNLKLTIGTPVQLWNKVMKEVKEKRYAGPYKQIPFEEYYIQSPIGLVPKDGGVSTRLIFHLSYPRMSGDEQKSVNANTPVEAASVQYPDFNDAIKLCLQFPEEIIVFIGKSDLKSAFRNLGIRIEDWPLLIMKAVSPIDGETYYFVDKCLPFGAAISCSHFQAFSDALKHLYSWKTQSEAINYLDDFFFVAHIKAVCNERIQVFLDICSEICFPVSLEKTFWATTLLSFLGLLIDTIRRMVFIPMEKITRAIEQIEDLLNHRSATVKQLQRLTGLLNFFGRCVIPARVFTRRLYSLTCGITDKPHYHVRITNDTKLDLIMWKKFLTNQSAFNRPFADFDDNLTADIIDMYTDSSANANLGCGGKCDSNWFVQQWDGNFIHEVNPSINYLELYAVTVAVYLWIHRFKNKKVTLFCDNMSVVNMINNKSSKCKNCMVLLRLIVLKGLIQNVSISADHVMGVRNTISDLLSRQKVSQFRNITKNDNYDDEPTPIPDELWPMDKLWLKN